MNTRDARIDEYIAKSATFAQPILIHLRGLIHKSCPDATETMKWSFPHFECGGDILCSMASFKKHCSFGFWKASLLSDHDNLLQTIGKTAMGSLGQISDLSDLPSDAILGEYIMEAAKLNREGIKVAGKPKKQPEKETIVAEDIIEALSANPAALKTFDNFSPSNKKEYVEWITGAKTESTRQSRLDTAIEWMAEGKIRHWKYAAKTK